jgi:hypothetical protein
VDDSHAAGLVTDSWSDLSWGVGFFDFNNDGWKDVFVANGHIYPQVDRVPVNTSYRQKNKLYLNNGTAKLINASAAAGPGLQLERSSRGAAFADFNNDGRIDIAVLALDEPPALLMNQRPGAGAGHWLIVKLDGERNRFGVGARVTVKSAGGTGMLAQTRELKAGGSYASSNDPRAHFGLGEAARATEVRVAWPSGKVSVLREVKADQVLTVREEGVPAPPGAATERAGGTLRPGKPAQPAR